MTPRRMFVGVWVALLVAALLAIVAVGTAGCGDDATAASASAPAMTETTIATEKTLVDMGGNEVIVPATVERIAITCQGGAAQEVAVLGGAGKIVALPSQKKFTTLLKAYPGLAELPEVGTFDNVNIESLLGVKADVVISSKSAKKGNEAIRNAGIPVIEINTGANNKVEACEKEFRLIGELLGDSQTAGDLVAFWDQQLQSIADRLESVPPEDRVEVYYVLGALTHTNGGELWGQALISAAGGINVAETLGTVKDIDPEQVIKWNPEAMILSSNEGQFVSIGEILDNAQLKGIEAVKSRKIFLCPVSGFWWDRPSPEAILGITWLARTLYPEQCKELDLESLTKEFFKRFYDYELSTPEFEAFLAPTS
ncbi:MAG: ABC transporter substrate-binding protein [Thermoleophilia bacterium]|nr:ABC transporter substrate-binding protein [Thermoleophilia bacterium]